MKRIMLSLAFVFTAISFMGCPVADVPNPTATPSPTATPIPEIEAPSAPDLAAADDSGLSDADNITNVTVGLSFSGTGGQAGQEVKLYQGATLLGQTAAGPSGEWSLDIALAEGIHDIVAKAAGDAGNESPASPPLEIVVDATAPASLLAILKPFEGRNTQTDKRPVFTWKSSAASCELQADDDPAFGNVDYDWTNLFGSSFRPDAGMGVSAAAPVGRRYYLRMRDIDAAGNPGAWSGSAGGALRYVNVGRFDDDLNGDGYSDAIVGESHDGTGKAFIYYGGSAMDNVPDLTLTGESAFGYFGAGVNPAGDLNGDGYCDAIVGDCAYDDFRGRAYVFYGGSSMDAVADATLSGEATHGYFGSNVCHAGDVNGDGFGDAIIGETAYDGYRGRAFVYLGGSPMDASADAIMTGGAAGEYFGNQSSSAGDMDGDGFCDVLISAPGYNGNEGRAYVYRGGSSFDTNADAILTGELCFGVTGDSAGDVNDDGFCDAIVSEPGIDNNRGRVYIFFGGPSLDSAADMYLDGLAETTTFGECMSISGDVNGDGISDVIIGAGESDGAQGRVYLFFGGHSMDSTADVAMAGEAALNFFGQNLALAGDLNGDGFDDAIVGANGYDSLHGRAYIYFGGASMDGTADLIMTGTVASGELGSSVY